MDQGDVEGKIKYGLLEITMRKTEPTQSRFFQIQSWKAGLWKPKKYEHFPV
mgnify:CR=1 FL=1